VNPVPRSHVQVVVSGGRRAKVVTLDGLELWRSPLASVFAVGLARVLCRAHKRQTQATRLLALGTFKNLIRRRERSRRLVKLFAIGLVMRAMRYKKRYRIASKVWAVGLFLRVRKRRKEEIRKLRFEEAMTALRTSAQTRLKNLHWDVLATVDGTIFDHDMDGSTLGAPSPADIFPTWRSSLDKRLEQHLLQGLGARRHLQSL